jgi:hypothetical protein
MAELSDFSGVLGQEVYSPLFESLGFSNWNDPSNFYTNEGGGISEQNWNPSSDAYNFINSKNLDFNWTPDMEGGGVLGMTGPDGLSSMFRQKGDDDFTKLVGMVAPAVASWGFGGALSGMFGGGMTGGALGHGLSSGSLTAAQGGDFNKGFLSGAIGGGLNGLAQGTPAVMGNNPSAYVPATPGTSIAGLSGITNPTLAGMVNRGAGSVLGTLAQGGSGSDALKSGLTGAALSGINSVGKSGMDWLNNSLKGFLSSDSTPDMEFDALQGSGGDMSEFTDVSPNRYAETITGSDGLESYNADYGFGGDQLAGAFSGGIPQQSIQSVGQSDFSLPSIFGNVGSSLGNFALNNAGDLASMLYGFYNNRRQQKQLGQQMSTLQGLYGQNSPYATQLRNTLNAKAAATGRRSNVAGRETQLQAMLANKASSLMPTLMQMNQDRRGLQNANLDILKMGLDKTGAFKMLNNGLQSLFGPSTTTIPYNNDYNLLGMLEGGR